MRIISVAVLTVGIFLGVQAVHADMIEVELGSLGDLQPWTFTSQLDPSIQYEVTPVLIEGAPEPEWSFVARGIKGVAFNMPEIVAILAEVFAGAERCTPQTGRGLPPEAFDQKDCWLYGFLFHVSPGLGGSKAGIGVAALEYQERVDSDGKVIQVITEKHSIKAIALKTYVPPTRPPVYYVGGEIETTLGLRARGAANPNGRTSGYLGLVVRTVDGRPDMENNPWGTLLLSAGLHINY